MALVAKEPVTLLREFLVWYRHCSQCLPCATRGAVHGCGVGLRLLTSLAVDVRYTLAAIEAARTTDDGH